MLTDTARETARILNEQHYRRLVETDDRMVAFALALITRGEEPRRAYIAAVNYYIDGGRL